MQDWFNLKWFSLTSIQKFEWMYPDFFYTLILIPLLFFFKWIFSSQKQQTLILTIGKIKLKSDFLIWFRYLIPTFFVLGIIAIIFALARPQLQNESKLNYSEGIDIALAIDISKSMEETDLKPDRLSAAKDIARDFIKGRQSDRVALVTFASEPSTLSPLTTDYELLDQYLANLTITNNLNGGTAIGTAVASCINKLRDVGGKTKIAILLSDGSSTTEGISPENAIDLAKTFNIKLYTVAIGTNSENEKVDEKTLLKLASGTSGSFFRAKDNQALSHIFETINKLEKSKFNDPSQKDMVDYYYIYLHWAIVFFLIAFLLKSSFLGNLLED